MMKYKGYVGVVEFDHEAKIFHGDVIGLKDVITFQGTSVDELEQAFKDSIDDYLAWCAERDEKPEKMFSGKLHVRMNPELHADLAAQALHQKISLNDLIIAKLSR